MADETDLYSDGQSEAPAETKDDSGSNDSLLPKEFFQGKELEVGSRCEVEITRVLSDQVLVKYVPHTEDESGVAPRISEEGTAQPVDAEMSEMMGAY